MNFKSKGELLLKLRSFKNIGEGSQGVCYLDKNNGIGVNSKIKVTNYYDYGVIIKLHFSIPLFS